MSKNQTKAPKTGSKEAKATKAPKAPKAPQAAAETVEQPITEEQVRVQMTTNPSGFGDKIKTLSPDAKIQAFNLLDRSIVNPPDPALSFPLETRKQANLIVAIGTVTTLMDHCANGDDTFALLMQKSEYAGLIECAKKAGYDISFPDIKSLPAGEKEGTVLLGTDKVKISNDTKKQLKKEKEIRDGEKPELDPTKITSEEDVSKALEYMFLSGGKRLPVLLTEAIDFMKKFRMHEASQAENAEEAKARFENYNSGDWLDDVFSYFRPPVFFTGIGRGMATVTSGEKSPIHAFTILRDAIKDKDSGEPVLEDQETAYCARSIMKWYCNTNIESNKKAIENLDPKKNKTEIEKCEAQIQHYNDILTYITSPSAQEIDELLDNIGATFNEGGTLTQECQKANATFNRICKSYYGKQLSDADYKNLDRNIQEYGYHIINLFRSPGEQIMDRGLSNIGDLVERSAEEREAMLKEAKKKWAERKTAEKGEAAKNE